MNHIHSLNKFREKFFLSLITLGLTQILRGQCAMCQDKVTLTQRKIEMNYGQQLRNNLAKYNTSQQNRFLPIKFQKLVNNVKKPTTRFTLKELTGLVDKYMVYRNKVVQLGMVPPKIRIILKERQKDYSIY